MIDSGSEFTPLSQEETAFLLKQAKQGDKDAKDKLISGNFPLIKSVLKRYQFKGVSYEDLYQLGCVGFLKAINNFDESFGVKFSTYAVPMIAGEIKRFLRDDGMIKVSRAIKSLSAKIRNYLEEYKINHDESPTIEELAEKFEADPEDVVLALDSQKETVSLYEKTDDKSETSPNLIDKIITIDNNESILDNLLLKNEIAKLDERDKKIILLRYFRGKTQSEVALSLGVSQVQVSRIEAKIIENLRKKLK
ncbi:MAG: SigB/SigF/SigG family RNA polymerase sigma factor [Clostridia bacterium]|nr:SigB/SigF/SigG family RNA polymerase sigma factor [Clostridia bacterium]